MATVTAAIGVPSARRPGRRAARQGWSLVAVAIALVLAVPALVVLGHVFAPAGEIWQHLAATVLPRYVTNSLLLMLGVGAGVAVVGVGTAWLVTMCRFPGRGVFEWALLLPMAMPAYVIAYTYTGLFDFAGPVQTLLRDFTGWGRADYWFPQVRSLPGAIVIMTLVLYPYVYLLSRAAFLEQSVCALEVSRTLGCGPWRSFATVALPLARPAIAGGIALALMEVLNDFGAVQHFGVDTFTTGIYRTWLGLREPAAAAQLAAILLLFVFAVLLLERWSRGQRRFSHTTGRYRPLPRGRLGGIAAAGAMLACGLPLLLGFLTPSAALAVWCWQTAGEWVDARFVRLLLNSLLLAAGAATLAVLLALLLAYAARLRHDRVTGISVRLAGLGYAVPGSVIAVGVMLPLGWLDNRIDGFARETLGVSTGLILSGTLVAVLFAYLVRFMALSLTTVEAGLGKITPSMEQAARSLGLTPLRTLVRVHAPLLRGSALTAALLVFVDVMKELPATLVLRPFNFGTLATHTYELATDEFLREASSSALAIVAAGIAPVVLLSLAIARSRPGHGGA